MILTNVIKDIADYKNKLTMKKNKFMILLVGLAILNTTLYYTERVYLVFKNLFKTKHK